MRAGMDPESFWNITPWQFSLYIEAAGKRREDEHDHASWIMWHGAVLSRWPTGKKAKKFPDLKKFLSGALNHKKHIPRIDENAIMAQLKAYSREYKKVMQK